MLLWGKGVDFLLFVSYPPSEVSSSPYSCSTQPTSLHVLPMCVGVIWTGRWAGDRKERIPEATL